MRVYTTNCLIRQNIFSYLLIILFASIVYFNSLFNGFIIGDDEDQILNNPLVHSVQNIPQIFQGSTYYQEASQTGYGLFYRPLMLTSYSVIYQIFGADPLIYHLVQIIFHTANGCLVYWLLRQFHLSNLASLFAAVLFIVHPIQSETVLHLANLQEVLFLFFGLLSVNFYLVTYNRKNILISILISLSLLVSLLAKETAVLFIFVMAFMDWLVLGQKPKSLIISVPSMLGYGFLRLVVAGVKYELPSISRIANLSVAERFELVPSVLAYYLKTLVWPDRLVTQQFWLVDQIDWLAVVGLISLAIGILLGILKLKLRRRVGMFFFVWIVLGLAFHSQVMPLYLTVAERWFYFPMIGIVGLFAVFFEKVLDSRVWKIGLIIILCVLSCRTFIRTFDWRDSYTLLSADIGQAPDDFYNQNLMASLLIRDDKYQQALPFVETSVAIHSYGGNLSNLGSVRLHLDDQEGAEKAFKQSLMLGQTYQAVVNYINFVYYIKNDTSLSLALVANYLEVYPKGFDLWLVKAQAEYQTKNQEEALRSAQNAYELNSNEIATNVLTNISNNRTPDVRKLIH